MSMSPFWLRQDLKASQCSSVCPVSQVSLMSWHGVVLHDQGGGRWLSTIHNFYVELGWPSTLRVSMTPLPIEWPGGQIFMVLRAHYMCRSGLDSIDYKSSFLFFFFRIPLTVRHWHRDFFLQEYQQLAAVIVLTKTRKVNIDSILEWCSTELNTEEIPTIFKLVLNIPRDNSGHVDKIKLRPLFHEEDILCFHDCKL